MSEQRDLRVFISWSGPLAKEVAIAIREWLPGLFDKVQPWASDKDIQPGQRGLDEIESELAGSTFGIIVVTTENQNSQWLNFEAGALSKTVGGTIRNRVVPILIDFESDTEVTGPISQFQMVLMNGDGMRRVVRSLGEIVGVNEVTVDQRFDLFWPKLQEQVEIARSSTLTASSTTKPEKRQPTELLEEILSLVRDLNRRSGSTSELTGYDIERLLETKYAPSDMSGVWTASHRLRFPDAKDSREVEVRMIVERAARNWLVDVVAFKIFSIDATDVRVLVDIRETSTEKFEKFTKMVQNQVGALARVSVRMVPDPLVEDS